MAEIHYSMLQGENSDGASWIGGTDQVKKGYWQWTDCSPWNFAAWSEPTLPDHRQIEQSCAAIFRKEGKDNWNYHPCNDAYILKFVCSRHICFKFIGSDCTEQTNQPLQSSGKGVAEQVEGEPHTQYHQHHEQVLGSRDHCTRRGDIGD